MKEHHNKLTAILLAIWQMQLCAATPCQHLTEMWGAEDPNVYYVCDMKTETALQLRCPEGSGFFHGLGYYGCLPYAQWPACVSAVVHGNVAANATTQNCDGSAQLPPPWSSSDPNTFYMCVTGARDPVLARCEQGRGFVQVTLGAGISSVGASSITGCAEWAKWRMYMLCEDFY